MEGTPPGPVLNSARGERQSPLSATPIKHQIDREIALLEEHIAELCVTQVSDDAMAPLFQEGDFVAGPRLSLEEATPFLNEPAIVQLPNQPLLVRKVIAGTQAGQLTLVSLNQATRVAVPNLYNVAPDMIAPIVWMRRFY